MDVWYAAAHSGAEIQQYRFHGKENQTWKLLPSDDSTYRIASRVSGRCISVDGDSTDESAPILQWDDYGTESQRWRFERMGDGTYHIVNVASEMCIAVDGASTKDGAPLIQYHRLNGNDQRWMILSTVPLADDE